MTEIHGRWNIPTDDVDLAGDEVHVWRAWLDPLSSRIERFRKIISPDEDERARSFHFERDRTHFIVARGTLRAILGEYLGCAAGDVRFRYNEYGKPALAGRTEIRFNVSHSAGQALYAVTRERRIGIDLERMRPRVNFDEIASRFFSPYEVATLQSLPVRDRPAAFYACWTRKEALVKAHGYGLSLPLDSFDVSLVPGEPACLLATRPPADDVTRWTLRELSPGAGYAAAVAVEGDDWRLQQWQFTATYPPIADVR